jgi:hypothetical protein
VDASTIQHLILNVDCIEWSDIEKCDRKSDRAGKWENVKCLMCGAQL